MVCSPLSTGNVDDLDDVPGIDLDVTQGDTLQQFMRCLEDGGSRGVDRMVLSVFGYLLELNVFVHGFHAPYLAIRKS
jgi:hypothetical protein